MRGLHGADKARVMVRVTLFFPAESTPSPDPNVRLRAQLSLLPGTPAGCAGLISRGHGAGQRRHGADACSASGWIHTGFGPVPAL